MPVEAHRVPAPRVDAITLLDADYYHAKLKPILAEWVFLWLTAQHVHGIDAGDAIDDFYVPRAPPGTPGYLTSSRLLYSPKPKSQRSLLSPKPAPSPITIPAKSTRARSTQPHAAHARSRHVVQQRVGGGVQSARGGHLSTPP